jgi:hypothetical protein
MTSLAARYPLAGRQFFGKRDRHHHVSETR